jgi:hypothetical protein
MSSSSRSQRLRVQKNVQDEKSAKKCLKSDNGIAKGKENESTEKKMSSRKKKNSESKEFSVVNVAESRPKREVKKTEKAKLLEEAKQTKTPTIAGTDLKSSQSDTPKGATATRTTKRGPTPKTEIRLDKKTEEVSPDPNKGEKSVPDVIAPSVVSKRGTRRKAVTGL